MHPELAIAGEKAPISTGNTMSNREKHLLVVWFFLNITIGFLIVQDYGISYDEPDYYLYAQSTVDAYRSFFTVAYSPFFGPNDLPNYGPAFIIFPELGIRILRLIFPDVHAGDIWHFSYFLIFQLGGLCLYFLARRWFSSWSAWGILVLYTSQPLLWGHSFINPKDIPFMAFFLFTIWSGYRLADSLAADHRMTIFHAPGMAPTRFRLRESLPYLQSPKLLLAGALLGMTMSIRLLGPLPGLIVILYLAFAFPQKWLSITAAYLICALVIMLLTWPYLWPNPLDHWMDSLVLMVRFPWPGRVLFNGEFYDPDGLPVSYLPVLLNIQLTEPLLVLVYLGFGMFVVRSWRKDINLDLFLALVIGSVLPLTGLILLRATMYDNFRQILFLLPPLMLFAGFALDLLFSVFRSVALRFVLLSALAIPGIYASFQLHPYQYIYYNSLPGQTGGAFRRFELDYWGTAYREAALWLNEYAGPNATIGSNEADDLLAAYLRRDLVAEHSTGPGEQYDYLVLTSRYNHDLTLYPEADVVHSIARDGAVLAVIKQPSP